MKKLSGIILAGVIFLFVSGEASAHFSGSGGSFMRIEYRDAMNRRVSGPAPGFDETTFSRFYTMFSPQGVSRWRGSAGGDTYFTGDSKFNLPYITPSLILSERELLPKINSRHIYSSPAFPGIIFLLSLAAVLSFKPRLQTDLEPRFQIPVLLE